MQGPRHEPMKLGAASTGKQGRPGANPHHEACRLAEHSHVEKGAFQICLPIHLHEGVPSHNRWDHGAWHMRCAVQPLQVRITHPEVWQGDGQVNFSATSVRLANLLVIPPTRLLARPAAVIHAQANGAFPGGRNAALGANSPLCSRLVLFWEQEAILLLQPSQRDWRLELVINIGLNNSRPIVG